MCYAIPGKVEKIEKNTVIVDYFGEKRKAYNELESLSPGDYIYAQGGFVIRKISVSEAETVLNVWKEEFFNLQETDLRLSRLNLEKKGVSPELIRILDKAVESRPLDKEELLYLLGIEQGEEIKLFFKTANFLRQKYHKNSCCVHGIIEISNYCRKSCSYCGISNQNRNLRRYRMKKKEILNAAYEAIEVHGFKALVLQRGEDNYYSVNDLADIIEEIRRKWPALIFISFGEIGVENLEALYKSGARGMLMRFETSNPDIYKAIHPGQNLDSRIAHIKKAYEIGYLVLTGGLVGLPGQTNEDIINDIFLAKDLRAEMFSFGPFLPHPDTPMSGFLPVKEEYMLKVLALARLMDNNNAKILVTTALETLNIDAGKKALLAGANSLMLNVTPLEFRDSYAIYPNRAHAQERIETQIEGTISLLRSLGRAPTDLSI